MKGIRKIRSKKGETLVEILVAILIIALSAALFATMYMASMKINTTAREADEKFYDAVGKLEEMIDSGDAESIQGNLTYTPTGENAEGGGNTFEVDVFTKDGMSVYKDKEVSP